MAANATAANIDAAGSTMTAAERAAYNLGTEGANKGILGSAMEGWNKMGTIDKLLASKIGADVVGGVAGYVSPSPQQKAQTGYYNAAAQNTTANAAKTEQDAAIMRQRIANLNANNQQGLGIGTNPNAVQIRGPQQIGYTIPGLINSARG
jgi:hypothetical protein